jgi:lipid II:glycine glycyltransferase (peptidoglycan interpeptide bridge formation enzyme)
MIEDIRQSENWAQYLSTLGWKSSRTDTGVSVALLNKFSITFAKIQRPLNLTQEKIESIEKIREAQNIHITKIEPADNTAAELLSEMGYMKTNDYLSPPRTIIIDLEADIGTLERNLPKKTRYYIRKSNTERSHTYIHKNPSEDQIKMFYRVYEASTVHNKSTKISIDDIRNKVKTFKDSAYISISHNDDGEACSAGLFLSHNNGIWYVHGGVKRLDGSCSSGYQLMWNSMVYFKDEGYSQLDLEGIYDPRYKGTEKWRGFSFYKSRFGGREVEFPGLYAKYKGPILNTISKIYPL